MSLRISTPSPNGRPRRGPGDEFVEPDFYMSRLIKLLPAEAVAIYPILQNRANSVAAEINEAESVRRAAETTGYVTNTTDGFIEQAPQAATFVPVSPEHWLPVAMAWTVLVLVIFIRWQATRGPNGDAQWGAVAIAAISFFLWVPTMHGSFGVMELAGTLTQTPWPEPLKKFVPELLLVFWTILVPVFYKPSN